MAAPPRHTALVAFPPPSSPPSHSAARLHMAQRAFRPLHLSLALAHTHARTRHAAELGVCVAFTPEQKSNVLWFPPPPMLPEKTIQAFSVKAGNADSRTVQMCSRAG